MAEVVRTALVTDAAGRVGTHLVPALLDAGWTVRALGETDAARHDRVDVVTADPTDADALLSALTGVQTVFHLGSDESTDAAREAARLFVDTAHTAGVGRIVHLTTAKVAPEASGRRAVPEVIDVLLDSDVPVAVIQAKRVPVESTVDALVQAAELDPQVNEAIALGSEQAHERLGEAGDVPGFAQTVGFTVKPDDARKWGGSLAVVAAGVTALSVLRRLIGRRRRAKR